MRWLAGRPLYETQLIAEDLHDVNVLVGAAVDNLNDRYLSALRVRIGGVPGGGGNTHRAFADTAVVKQRISICFADSDKECPLANVGPTAEKCQEVAGPGLYDLQLTSGRSLENALPWSLLDQIRPDRIPSPRDALARVETATPGATRFVNLKRGVFAHDIHRLGYTACAGYWAATRRDMGRPSTPACCATGCKAAAVGSCSEKFIDGYGNSTLADAERWLESSSSNRARHSGYISSADSADWRALGKWVAEYGLGMPPRRL